MGGAFVTAGVADASPVGVKADRVAVDVYAGALSFLGGNRLRDGSGDEGVIQGRRSAAGQYGRPADEHNNGSKRVFSGHSRFLSSRKVLYLLRKGSTPPFGRVLGSLISLSG